MLMLLRMAIGSFAAVAAAAATASVLVLFYFIVRDCCAVEYLRRLVIYLL